MQNQLLAPCSSVAGDIRVDVRDPRAPRVLGRRITGLVRTAGANLDAVVVLCIGTDRSTGDAFGPLVGSRLVSRGLPGAVVRGTVERPVHAGNLASTLVDVHSMYRRSFVIAVDASLGPPETVGTVTVGPGPLRPGAGVHKALPIVGNAHATGVVNAGGFMEYFVLQNTRLRLVMAMANLVADALWLALAAGPATPASWVASVQPPDGVVLARG